MKATELIGKNVVRTKHITLAGGTVCRSFMEEPIEIINATDSHIVYKWKGRILRIIPDVNDRPHLLSYEYCDDNWTDFDELINKRG